MENVSNIGVEVKVETCIDKPDIRFYDALSAPFEICGVFYENGMFRRMPEDVARGVSQGVYDRHANTAGGRLRFRTNSSYIAIHTKLSEVRRFANLSFCAIAGFDLYVKNDFITNFKPPYGVTDGFESVIELGKGKMRDITINFPLYCNVEALYIGLQEGALLEAPIPYADKKPIVYYGSSITQGANASRPGNSYQNMIARELGIDFVNLGFSGNARGEAAIAEYIKGLEMSVFVYDYDHNAPTVEFLDNTHEAMFRIVREANPELPVIIMSRPKWRLDKEENEKERLAVIRKTYENALARGDQNVYFIEGKRLMKIAKTNGTVDGCHPNDLGFYSIAQELMKALKKVL